MQDLTPSPAIHIYKWVIAVSFHGFPHISGSVLRFQLLLMACEGPIFSIANGFYADSSDVSQSSSKDANSSAGIVHEMPEGTDFSLNPSALTGSNLEPTSTSFLLVGYK